MHAAFTLDALKVLNAIDQKGSFAGAAEALYKVPSALTYTMQKLETDLGVSLFDRTGQKAKLTPAGRLVLHEGQEILQAAVRLQEKVQQLDSGWETKIVMAKDTVVPDRPMFEIISDFCKLDKLVELEIIEEALGGGWDALYSQRADIAIGVGGELPKGQFNIIPMGSIEFAFVVASHHPLAEYIGTVESELISQYPSIVVSDSSRSLPERNSGLFDSKQQIKVSNMASKLEAQIQGVGTGFLPLHIAKPFLESGALVAKSTPIPRPAMPVYVAAPRAKSGLALDWFLQKISNKQWFE
jgi:DNA-binding transcriptional LysR family regulator